MSCKHHLGIMFDSNEHKKRIDGGEFLPATAADDTGAFGDYAWSLRDRGVIARWETGVGENGEVWADLLDFNERVVWRLERSGRWYILIDDRGQARSASRRLQETLAALP